MSDEEDTANLLSKGKINTSYKKMTVIIPINSSPLKQRQPSKASIQIASIITLLGGFIFGYDVPNVLSFLPDYATTFQLNCIQQTLLFVVWFIAGIIAFILVRCMTSVCNRSAITYSIWIILCGTLLVILSTHPLMLFCGHGLIGFGCIFSASSHYAYIAELSDNKWRGFRISLHQFGISVGIFVCLVTAYLFKSSEYGWRIAAAFNLIPIALHFLLSMTLESTKKEEQNTLHTNRTKINYLTILILYGIVIFGCLNGRNTVLTYAPTAFIKLGIAPENTQQTVSITISIVQLICTGISLTIIDRLGRKSTLIMSYLIMLFSSIVLALLKSTDNHVQVIMNIIKYGDDYCPRFRVIDSAGILAFGVNGMNKQTHQSWDVFSNGTVSESQDMPPFPMLPTPLSLVDDSNSNDINLTSDVLVVIAILVFEAAYSLGPATVLWVTNIEIFPASIRFSCITDIVACYWVINSVTSLYISTLSDVGMYLTDPQKDLFLISSRNDLVFNIIYNLFIIFIVLLFIPETKGRYLEEIAVSLKNSDTFTTAVRHLTTFIGCGRSKTLSRDCSTSLKLHAQETVI